MVYLSKKPIRAGKFGVGQATFYDLPYRRAATDLHFVFIAVRYTLAPTRSDPINHRQCHLSGPDLRT